MTEAGIKIGFVPEFEGLRGFLASWVFAFHVMTIDGHWQALSPRLQAVLDGGRAVQVFIILSGFVIAGLVIDKRESYSTFIARRFFRIYPVYVVCVGTALLASFAGVFPARYDENTLLAHLLAHATMLHGAVPEWILAKSSGAILNPAWSVSLEWQFYLIAPLLLSPRRITPALVVCCIAYRVVLPRLHGFDEAFLLSGLPLFWVGIAFAILHRTNGAAQLSLIGIATCALFMPLASSVGLLIWLLVYAAITHPHAGRGLTGVLTLPSVLHLGKWSYSIYLSHEVVISTVEHFLPQGLHARAFVVLLLSAGGTLVASAALHRWVEQPFMRLGRRYVLRETPAAHAILSSGG